MPINIKKLASSLALGLLLATPAMCADDPNAVDIQKVTFTFNSGDPNPTQMDIYGTGFGATAKPTVTIDGLLPNISLYTNTRITVTLAPPLLAAGNYRITVKSNAKSNGGDDSKKTGIFDATIAPPAPTVTLASLLGNKSCPANTYLSGFDALGGLSCTPLPAPPPSPAPAPSPAPGPNPAPAPAPAPSPAPAPAPAPAPSPAPGPNPV